jgi:hypothetical protein
MNLLDSATMRYRAYLLRLRYMDNGGQPRWVYSLQSPDGGEHHEFQTLQAFAEFLARQTPPCDPSRLYPASDGPSDCEKHDKSGR